MSQGKNNEQESFEIEVFYDGECPLCIREINMLKRLDKELRIKFSDIANAEFNMSEIDASWSDLMNSIHGRLPNGRLIKGVEVFRRLYSAVGFGALVKISRLPLITNLLDLSYKIYNTDRSVGAMLSGYLAKIYGHEGLKENSIYINLQGTAGQSFGAFTT